MQRLLVILNLMLYAVLDLTLIQNGISGLSTGYWIINAVVMAIGVVCAVIGTEWRE